MENTPISNALLTSVQSIAATATQFSGQNVSKSSSKARTRHKTMLGVVYVSIMLLIVAIASIGYQSPVQQQLSLSQNDTGSASSLEIIKPSVDQIAVADLAAATAQTADLSVATNVSNMSISLNAKTDMAQTDEQIISKPQIFEATESRGLKTYTTKTGDTVPAVAALYGVSSETVRWANNLTSDALEPDRALTIPAVDGVVYTVKNGDTADSIAKRYSAEVSRLIAYNDLEISGVVPSTKIIVPSGVLPEAERPGYVAPRTTVVRASSYVSYGGATSAAVVGNRYDYGYCTWYVYNRRAALARPVGSFWGNASTWAYNAIYSGYTVSGPATRTTANPQIGDVMQDSYSAGGYGHVAVVESVGADGSISISEMNYAGWNVYSTRVLSAGQAASYNFIH